MAGLDYLFDGTPASLSNATTSTTDLPDWYQDYVRAMAGKATQVAGQGYTPYPGQQVAGFNNDQQNAFQQVRDNQGSWQPGLGSAMGSASGIAGAAQTGTTAANAAGQAGWNAANGYAGQSAGAASGAVGAANTAAANANNAAQTGYNAAATGYGQSNGAAGSAIGAAAQGTQLANGYGAGAVGAVAGPSQNWTGNFQRYMSPYTQNVVDEIGRQGNLNLQQNILPGIGSTFAGSGQFGSGRNAAIMGQGIAQAQQGISGLQSQALENGYSQAGNLFNQDANRSQQQQQMQAQTGLAAGQLANSGAALNANTALGAAGQYGQNAQGLGSLGMQQAGVYNQAGQLAANTGMNAAQQYGALGSMMGGLGMQQGNLYNQGATINSGALDTQAQRMGALTQLQQSMQNQDTAALGAVGGQEQALQQAGDTAGYNDFQNQRNYDWTNLANMNSILRGMPLNSQTTGASNASSQGAGVSPLGWLSSLYGTSQYGTP